MASRPVKKVAKKAPVKKAAPKKVKQHFIAVSDCNEDDAWREFSSKAQLDDELDNYIQNCCGDDDCAIVYEVTAVYRVKRKGYELVKSKL